MTFLNMNLALHPTFVLGALFLFLPLLLAWSLSRCFPEKQHRYSDIHAYCRGPPNLRLKGFGLGVSDGFWSRSIESPGSTRGFEIDMAAEFEVEARG